MTAWMATLVGGDLAPLAAFLVWLIIAIVVVVGGIWIARRLLRGRFRGGWSGEIRLDVVDAAPIDNRRRLVLVRRDDVEHLIVIGGHTEFVVESNIRRNEHRAEHKTPTAEPVEKAAIAQPTTPRPARSAASPSANQQKAVLQPDQTNPRNTAQTPPPPRADQRHTRPSTNPRPAPSTPHGKPAAQPVPARETATPQTPSTTQPPKTDPAIAQSTPIRPMVAPAVTPATAPAVKPETPQTQSAGAGEGGQTLWPDPVTAATGASGETRTADHGQDQPHRNRKDRVQSSSTDHDENAQNDDLDKAMEDLMKDLSLDTTR